MKRGTKTTDQDFTTQAEVILRRCEQLAGLSSMPDAICRTYLSEEHKRANALVLEWLREAGMEASVDAAGSVRGRYAASADDAPVLIVGSHLDTVPDSGAYDGILGVLLGISAVAQLHADGRRLPFAIEVVGFGEEEGVRFGTTLMTSRALAGRWDASWWALQDAQGVTLEQAFREFGLDPEQIDQARLEPAEVLCYFEPHIEQGPVLEAADQALGVVTAIAGAKRANITIVGQAGHAGTVPMALRKDALLAAAFAVSQAEAVALKHDVVATVGRLQVQPGGVNVIPGCVELSLDVRSGDNALRDAAFAELHDALLQECNARGLELTVEVTHEADAAPCAPELCRELSSALASVGQKEAPLLASGAGHDAMALAKVCDIAMLFIRCTGGISHNPAEAVLPGDVAVALQATLAFIDRLANRHAA